MIEDIKRVLKDKCQLDPSLPVLAGISGGPDSLCLLDLLRRLEYRVVVAHLNHQLRSEAEAEAELVESFAEAAGFPVIIGLEDVEAYANSQSLSIEEAGRIQRYQFLFDKADEFGPQAVLVGHNADDQAETVLMHITRGSGLAGLRGMAYLSLPNTWSNTIPLARPLLGVWREEILTYLEEHNIKPSYDPTNLDTMYARNRLRHELIPTLETYNPGVRRALWRLGAVAGQDYALLEGYIAPEWEHIYQDHGSGYIALDLHRMKERSVGIQRYILRRAISVLLGDLSDIDYAAIERATAYLGAPTPSGDCDLKAGVKMFAEGKVLWLVTGQAQFPAGDSPQIDPGTVLELDVPGTTALPGGWVLACEVVDKSEDLWARIQSNTDHYQAWINAEAIPALPVLRTRAPGDRFQPLGMEGGSTKMSDFMINERVPERLRRGWPLLYVGEEIVWVVGYRVNHRYRVTDQSERVLHLKLEKLLE